MWPRKQVRLSSGRLPSYDLAIFLAELRDARAIGVEYADAYGPMPVELHDEMMLLIEEELASRGERLESGL